MTPLDVPAVGWLVPWLTVSAVAVAVGWTVRAATGRDFPAREAYRAAVLAAVAGGLGGAALHALVHGAWGGQSVFGVFAGGAVAGAAYLRLRGLPILDFADAAAPGVALGYAVARVGCFLNGDDFGVRTGGWGVSYPAGTEAWADHVVRGWIPADAGASLPVVPVQLLLAGAGVAIFAGLYRSRLRPGAAVAVAASAYAGVRFLTEPLRQDFAPVAGSLSLPQILSLALLVAAVAGWGAGRRRHRRLEPARATGAV
jgi:phosphatidylglycerol:prolipoprotein diacylglycerol transferase